MRLQKAQRFVCHGKRSSQFDGGFVIGKRGLPRSRKAAKIAIFGTIEYLGKPISSPRFGNALKRTFGGAESACIPKVLPVSANPQVRSLVIEPIAIDVVNLLEGAKDLLHSDRPLLAPKVNGRFGVPSIVGFLCVPFVLAHSLVISVVNKGNFALRKFNLFHAPI